MTTRTRESPSNSSPRNKENDPFNAKGARHQFIPSLSKSPDKSEFFTDTLLDNSDASQRSLIPLPKSSKDNHSHPRKNIRTGVLSRNSKPPQKHRATRSDLSALPIPDLKNSFSTSLARDTSPLRSTGLSTPPRSRDGSTIASPLDSFSSPPRALTETYERIDQEEDLAATEGEISDPEGYDVEDKENGLKVNGVMVHKNATIDSPGRLPRSRTSTPTDRVSFHRTPRVKELDITAASVLSDPTGMSFVRELSNPNLQLALTPLVLESARDRKALEQAWSYKKPVAFSKAGRVAVDNIDLLNHSPPGENLPPRRLISFSRAGKIKLASDLKSESQHHRAFSDSNQRPTHNREVDHASNHDDNWHRHEVLRELTRHNPRLHHENFFSQNHGFPARAASGTSAAEVSGGNEAHLEAQPNELPVNPLFKQSFRPRSMGQLHNDQINEHNMAEIDWMQVAVDEPVKTVEDAPSIVTEDNFSITRDLLSSPEKSRRLDVDFTGQSFQVSESPPVRAKNMVTDYSRTKEMEGLAKQAVTTNRLTQLRARESYEQLGATSRSPVLETIETDRLQERPWRSNSLNSERPSDSPVLNFRTSLPNGVARFSSTTNNKTSPNGSRSHDILQRLARGSSSTPRSTTPSEKLSNLDMVNAEREENEAAEEQVKPTNARKHSPDPEADINLDLEKEFKPEPVLKTTQQTPRVVGSWSDTVLPDTIKPAVRIDHSSKYAQTPHVSTGAWIDTPAPNIQPTKLDPVMEVLQEIPEELMSGIFRDKTTARHQGETVMPPAHISEKKATLEVPLGIEESLAKKVLTEAKGKFSGRRHSGLEVTENTGHSVADDTLALGSATVQSLENFLDMDETDLTILSRLNEDSLGPTETEVIFRLVSKLDRLRTHLSDAQKGISHIEYQISSSEPQQTIEAPQLPSSEQIGEQKIQCSECNIITTKPETHLDPSSAQTAATVAQSKSMLPFTLLSVVVPIPILFRPAPQIISSSSPPKSLFSRSLHRTRLLQPTPLGWLVIAIWTWYFLECTLCEIYSRPQYAPRYSWPVLQEPEFPFVLPTMLYRWSRLNFLWPSIVQPFLGIFIGIFRIVGMWLGFTDGFIDGPLTARGSLGAMGDGSSMYQQQQEQPHGINTGMMDMTNDEFL